VRAVVIKVGRLRLQPVDTREAIVQHPVRGAQRCNDVLVGLGELKGVRVLLCERGTFWRGEVSPIRADSLDKNGARVEVV